ncbi:MAG: PLP-dependent aminotransferase family protein [Acidimicrobiales bacterium]
MPAHLLNTRARAATTSAIRDLLEHAQQPGMISLAGGLPDPDRFPTAALADIAAEVLRHDGRRTLQYGLTAGERDLRAHIVATTPCATDIDAVVVTTGSQQGLELLAGVLVDPGDTVVVADPEYLGAAQSFRRAGARLAPVPVDDHGLDIDELDAALRGGLRPKFAYLVPHFHNPSGGTLSASRRHRLLELAERYGFLVVLDDPYRELFVDTPPDDIAAPHPMVVHLRSSSKVLAPGLRVGWTIGPTWLTRAIERAKQSADLHTSTVSQAIVLRALGADWYPQHLDTLRVATRAKRDALCAALERELGDRIEFRRPGGGMFVWASLAIGVTTDELLPRALDQGVAFVPGSAFAVDRDLSQHLRLSWATGSPAELAEAVTRLARAIDRT